MVLQKHSYTLRWLLLFVGLIPSSVIGQRWADSVILTQHGPVPYKPVHHPRYGYYTADVLPVYPNDGKMEAWPPYNTAFDVPITSNMNVGQHPQLMTHLKSPLIPMKRKKSTLKKNPVYHSSYHKIPQYDKTNTKPNTSRQKHTINSSYDQRYRNSIQSSGYAYRGRRFQNRGMKVKQTEKILKGQVIDHNKGRDFNTHRPQSRSNKNELENQDVDHNRINQYFNNGHQGPDLGYFHYRQSEPETTDDAYFNDKHQ